MSRFEVKPRSFSTLTSTHSPWQSKPFCQRWSSPSMAWKRWKMSLYVRPQAWWTPIGLLAVIGPSRKLQRGPPAFCSRRRSNVRRSRQRASTSCSWATRSGLLLTGSNIGPRAERDRRIARGPAASRGGITGRHSPSDTLHGGSPYPTCDEPPAGTAAPRPVGLHGSLPLAPLPRPRARVRAGLVPGRGVRRAALPPAGPRPGHRHHLPHRAGRGRAPAAGPPGHPRRQHRRPPLPHHRRRRRLPGRRLPEPLGRGRRSARTVAGDPGPLLDRRPPRGGPRHGRRPRRRRVLRPAGPRPGQRRLQPGRRRPDPRAGRDRRSDAGSERAARPNRRSRRQPPARPPSPAGRPSPRGTARAASTSC